MLLFFIIVGKSSRSSLIASPSILLNVVAVPPPSCVRPNNAAIPPKPKSPFLSSLASLRLLIIICACSVLRFIPGPLSPIIIRYVLLSG